MTIFPYDIGAGGAGGAGASCGGESIELSEESSTGAEAVTALPSKSLKISLRMTRRPNPNPNPNPTPLTLLL